MESIFFHSRLRRRFHLDITVDLHIYGRYVLFAKLDVACKYRFRAVQTQSKTKRCAPCALRTVLNTV